jgi:hypothetical protein
MNEKRKREKRDRKSLLNRRETSLRARGDDCKNIMNFDILLVSTFVQNIYF